MRSAPSRSMFWRVPIVGRLRLIGTRHDPAVIRKILAHVGMAPSGPTPAPPHPSPAPTAP